MDANLNATYEACNSFNNKLKDTLLGLISANNDRKSEIDALRSDLDTLRKDHDSFVTSMERENDLRKNEIKAVDSWAKGENDARKKEIAALNSRLDSEAASKDTEDKALNARIDREISDRDKDTAVQIDLDHVGKNSLETVSSFIPTVANTGQTATKVATNRKRSARTDLTSQKGTKRQNTVALDDDDVQFLYQRPMELEWLDYAAMCREHKAQLRKTDEVRSGHLGGTWALLGQAGVAGGTSGAAGAGQHQCDAGGATCAASCIFSQNW